MLRPAAYFWKKTPFLRLVIAMMTGILIQWYVDPGIRTWYLLLPAPVILLFSFFFIPYFRRFQLNALAGLAASWIFISIGGILASVNDTRKHPQWYGMLLSPDRAILVTIEEPLVEKTKSFRSIASVSYLVSPEVKVPVKGKIILYFKKDSSSRAEEYGTQLLIKKKPEPVKGPGNPGSFDYREYCLFRGITHQVFLSGDDYKVLPGKKENALKKFIYSTKEKILDLLRKYVPGEKEAGLAEALLIGYKDDLDKSLVQSYSNTGVVHIIAVSGLHLGLIYWLMLQLLSPLRKHRRSKWMVPILVIAGLWIFSLLAGAQPSVLRSALMFTCIVIGESLDRKVSVFNTMAVSAFILLCINPFMLWDVGFQLSYAAVASIVIFSGPVYNWFYFKNRIVDMAWKLNSVTIAAQILTAPFIVYHFHQFPTWFLVTNFVAVPLSSFILLGEILLCAVSPIPSAGHFTGSVISWLIRQMNNCIQWVEQMPFAILDGLQIRLIQAILLLLVTAFLSWWLIDRTKKGLVVSLVFLLCFFTITLADRIKAEATKRIVIYDLPKKSAMDFFSGKQYIFRGDPSIQPGSPESDFHLKPARTWLGAREARTIEGIYFADRCIQWNKTRIFFADPQLEYPARTNKPFIDLLVISGNKPCDLKEMAAALEIRQVVVDGSVPPWKVPPLDSACKKLNIPFHAVNRDGAFVMNLQKPTFAAPKR